MEGVLSCIFLLFQKAILFLQLKKYVLLRLTLRERLHSFSKFSFEILIIFNESLTILVYFKLLGVHATFLSGQDKKIFLFHVIRDCETISGTSFLSSNQPNFIQVTFFTHCCICFLSLPVIQICLRRRQISFVTSF